MLHSLENIDEINITNDLLIDIAATNTALSFNYTKEVLSITRELFNQLTGSNLVISPCVIRKYESIYVRNVINNVLERLGYKTKYSSNSDPYELEVSLDSTLISLRLEDNIFNSVNAILGSTDRSESNSPKDIAGSMISSAYDKLSVFVYAALDEVLKEIKENLSGVSIDEIFNVYVYKKQISSEQLTIYKFVSNLLINYGFVSDVWNNELIVRLDEKKYYESLKEEQGLERRL